MTLPTVPDIRAIRAQLADFDFRGLFNNLGWDNLGESPTVEVAAGVWQLKPVAQKRGFAVFQVGPGLNGAFPDSGQRRAIDRAVARLHREHLLVFADRNRGEQVWLWTRREPGELARPREFRFLAGQPGQTGQDLAERLGALSVSLEEELADDLTLPVVVERVRGALDVEKVTKKFYDRYQKEHAAFERAIGGIPEGDDRRWYASVMLNRLMFVYFVQKKGFLNGDRDYLRHKLEQVQQRRGVGQFQTFYRLFLRRLFHEGLGAPEHDRDADLATLIGDVPYLNGGLFDEHALEVGHADIDISDEAFAALFAFFDAYQWRLDATGHADRPDDEIDPDVLGYIFEKYVNQKQMGAYYTKEDITGYIGRNTIVPAIFDKARDDVKVAFQPGSALWRLLRDDPDRYVYPAVRYGDALDLPAAINAGLDDVARRGGWNASAPSEFALPTETWRELVARRRRYADVKARLEAGEVSSIDDLVTLNLNIERFAQDAIEEAEGPEFVRAVWKALRSTTVLDPTCGSGAFLFAALTILQPLYTACLSRMREFVADADREGAAQRYEDFRETLASIACHPNEEYFVLKSIILDNLYGVDIMEEAVEICKLRLFLKLAAQVESVDQIEPLPDIDFNVRAGNTLVGFATWDDAKRALSLAGATAVGGETQARLDLFADRTRIEERAESAARAVRQFRDQQTVYSEAVSSLSEVKRAVEDALTPLRDELDRYLAVQYRVALEGAAGRATFAAWKASHQPFHWFVEFYGIMQAGGFDAIIGNPPYLETSKLGDLYRPLNFKTQKSRDIYAWIVERALELQNKQQASCLGLIVPVSISSSGSFAALRELVVRDNSSIWMSHFANRPSQLFSGAQNRLTILLSKLGSMKRSLCTSHYMRWEGDLVRETLFELLAYTNLDQCDLRFHGLIPKIGSKTHLDMLRKLDASMTLTGSTTAETDHPVYWVRVPGYFCQFFLRKPMVVPVDGRESRPRGELNDVCFGSEQDQRAAHAGLSSNLYYCFFSAYTDGRHINPSDVRDFPLNVLTINQKTERDLVACSERLEACLASNAVQRRKSGLLIESFSSARCKGELDAIDEVLARHYGFTPEELDFIINYDIKYRMGRDSETG